MDFVTLSAYADRAGPRRFIPPLLCHILILATLTLAACTGGVTVGPATTLESAYYTISGSVAGLTGSGLTLQNNNGDNLTLSGNGSFTFKTPLTRGNSYSVSVLTQPSAPPQTCVVTNGTGTVTGDNVSSVSVTCADKTASTDHIGGTVTGLAGTGLVLQDNGGDSLTVSSNGGFTFASPLPPGMPYAVTVLTPPTNPFQDCSIANGTGTTSADVNNIAVSCKTNSNPAFTIGGRISGIVSSEPITLQDNGTDNLTLIADGAFTFATSIPSGSAYSVTALSSSTSPTRTCAFTNATGIVSGSNVTNVSVACSESTPSVNITVNVTGLTGSGLVLQNNGADNLTITGNGVATFATGIASGSAFAVTVLSQPNAQTCTVANGTGTASSNTVPVLVNCAANAFSLSATVTGLAAGAQVTLNDPGATPLVVTANGTSTFVTSIPFNGSYDVTVGAQPAGQICTVSNGSGAGVTANVTVTVTCSTITYAVSATVSGLTAGKQVVLDNNGGNPLTVSTNGTFAFTVPVAFNGSYSVTIATQPVGETCTVSNGAGAGVTANVTATVTCSTITYTVSAAVSGLGVGKQVTLDNNGGNPLIVTANGTFAFTTPVAYNGSYAVTVGTQPVGQTCTVSNGTGAGVTANVTVTVTCSTITYTVSAAVSGLTAGKQVTLNNNGGNPLIVTANGTFAFSTLVAYNGSYAVTVGTQPVGQTCTVSNGTGAGVTANVTVTVTCSTITYTVSAAVSGLDVGKQVTLDNNGGNPLIVTANGTFAFTTPVAYNGSYTVTVGTEPIGQICTVINGTGAGVTANVTVTVTCSTITYTVNAAVSGLSPGHQVTLLNNGADALTVTSNGTFPFITPVAYGGAYSVTIGTQPVGESCAVTNGAGSNVSSNVTVTVSCAGLTISAIVSGLPAQTPNNLLLLNIFGQDASGGTTVNGTASFAQSTNGVPIVIFGPDANTASYTVTISQQPGGPSGGITGQTSIVCTIVGSSNGITVSGALNGNVSLNVQCVQPRGFAYVTNSGNGQSAGSVSGYLIDSTTGALVAFGTPVVTGTGPRAAIFDPIGSYDVFVANQISNTISSFSYDTNTGALAPLANIAAGGSPTSLLGAYTTTGGVVYVTNDGTPGTVSTFTNNAGALSALGTATAAGSEPWASLLSIAGNGLFVLDLGGNSITTYSSDLTTGALTPTSATTGVGGLTGVGPNAIVAGNSLPLGYFSATGTVTTGSNVMTIDTVSQGTLAVGDLITDPNLVFGTAIASFGTATGGPGTYILSNQASGTSAAAETITGNSNAASVGDGATEVLGSTVLTVTSASGSLEVGDTLFAAGLPTGTTIVSFGTGTGGTGTYNLSAAALRSGADFINASNSQRYVYDANSDGSISVLLNAAPPGNQPFNLTRVENDQLGIPGLSALAYYSSSNTSLGILYAIGTDGIHIFTLGAQGGIASSAGPVAVGSGPNSIAILGNFLYVTNSGDGTVSGFVITPATGALTPIPGSPFQCGSGPSSIILTNRPQNLG